MSDVQPFDWQRIFIGDAPPLFLLEIAFRTVFMYVFTLVLVRVIGKRGLTQLSPFEYIIIIVLGSAAGDPSFYPDVPLTHAMVVMTVVVALQKVLELTTEKNRRLEVIVEGDARRLVEDGRIDDAALDAENLSKAELFAGLRAEGVECLGQVKFAVLEASGRISVLLDRDRRDGMNIWEDKNAL
jgi:uncharacterized membrane protein YcaP (DUF421 family)